MTGDLGNNAFKGGNGIDTVTYLNVKAGDGGVAADLSIVGAQNTLASGFDTFVSIKNMTQSSVENLTGSVNDDLRSGNSVRNTLDGNAGNDTLSSSGGDDTLIGGLGDDRMDGGVGNDTDFFIGSDVATVNLGLNGAQTTGYGVDTLISIENLASGAADDRLTGSKQANTLKAGLGNDQIDGGAGHDTIYGSSGADRLTGGTGADAFVFDTDFGGGNFDNINDFRSVDDTIHLDNSVFALLSGGVLASSAFVANTLGSATHLADRIIYETDTGNLYYDSDGGGVGLAFQFATLESGPKIDQCRLFCDLNGLRRQARACMCPAR